MCVASQPSHVLPARPLVCRALDPDREAQVDLETGSACDGRGPRGFNSGALICLAQGSGRGPALAEGKSLAAAQPASVRKLPRQAMRMQKGCTLLPSEGPGDRCGWPGSCSLGGLRWGPEGQAESLGVAEPEEGSELGPTISSRHRTGSGPHKLERPAFILSYLAHILLPISLWVATFLKWFLHPRHHIRTLPELFYASLTAAHGGRHWTFF